LFTIHGEDITAVKHSNQKKSKTDTLFYFEVSTKHGNEILAAESENDANK